MPGAWARALPCMPQLVPMLQWASTTNFPMCTQQSGPSLPPEVQGCLGQGLALATCSFRGMGSRVAPSRTSAPDVQAHTS